MMSFYQLDAADRAAIIGARSSKEVPVKLRNKLYAALNRFLGKPSVVSKKVADQWAAAEAKGNHGKFEFLKQWAMDTKGGQIRLEDEYTKCTEDLDMDEYTWLTKCDLYNMKNAYKYQDMKIYCDKLMASAKTKAPQGPQVQEGQGDDAVQDLDGQPRDPRRKVEAGEPLNLGCRRGQRCNSIADEEFFVFQGHG
jgi:hypothetical protein